MSYVYFNVENQSFKHVYTIHQINHKQISGIPNPGPERVRPGPKATFLQGANQKKIIIINNNNSNDDDDNSTVGNYTFFPLNK